MQAIIFYSGERGGGGACDYFDGRIRVKLMSALNPVS